MAPVNGMCSVVTGDVHRTSEARAGRLLVNGSGYTRRSEDGEAPRWQGALCGHGVQLSAEVGPVRGLRVLILCSSGVFFHRSRDGALVVPEGPDVEAITSYGARLPADGIEVLVTRRMTGRLANVAESLTRSGLTFPVVHGPKRVGAALPAEEAVAQLAESAWFAAEMGASVLVLHLWDLPDGDTRFEERLEALVLALDVVGDYGVELAVETIPCLRATPLRNIERVLEHDARACVALDTEFLALHGELESALAADWLWRDGHVRHVHVKDFADDLLDSAGLRRYLLPGEGTIDFGEVFETLERRHFTGAVSLEAGAYRADGTPDLDVLSEALARMSSSPWRFSRRRP